MTSTAPRTIVLEAISAYPDASNLSITESMAAALPQMIVFALLDGALTSFIPKRSLLTTLALIPTEYMLMALVALSWAEPVTAEAYISSSLTRVLVFLFMVALIGGGVRILLHRGEQIQEDLTYATSVFASVIYLAVFEVIKFGITLFLFCLVSIPLSYILNPILLALLFILLSRLFDWVAKGITRDLVLRRTGDIRLSNTALLYWLLCGMTVLVSCFQLYFKLR